MKKYMTFLLAGLLACSLTACDKVKDKVEEVSAEISGKVEEDSAGKAKNLLEEIKQEGVLTIGISADYAPFCYISTNDNGDSIYTGSDVELGKYIAQELGVRAQFQEMSFENCLQSAKNGTVDMVLLGMMPVVERLAYVDFSTVYYEPGQQVFLMKKTTGTSNNDTINNTTSNTTNKQTTTAASNNKTTTTNTTAGNLFSSLDAFAGKTIAAQYGSLQAQLIIEQLPDSFMELADNVQEAVTLLENDVVDAVVLDETLALEYIEKNSDFILAEAVLEYTPKKIVAGITEGEMELLQAVNNIISTVVEQHLYFQWVDEANEKAMWDILTQSVEETQSTTTSTENVTQTSDIEDESY